MSKSTKSTKYFDLFSALKAGGEKGVSPESLAKTLDFSMGSLAVYIHALRHKFGAVIESVRNGRTVTAYRLTNIAECEKSISPNRKPRTLKVKAAPKKPLTGSPMRNVTKTVKSKGKKSPRVVSIDDGSVPVLEDMSITEYTDADLSDIKSQLGIG
jgi:biotin operon repressor